jgi:hypothetical protein
MIAIRDRVSQRVWVGTGLHPDLCRAAEIELGLTPRLALYPSLALPKKTRVLSAAM